MLKRKKESTLSWTDFKRKPFVILFQIGLDGDYTTDIDSTQRKPYEPLLIGRKTSEPSPYEKVLENRIICSVPLNQHSRKPPLNRKFEYYFSRRWQWNGSGNRTKSNAINQLEFDYPFFLNHRVTLAKPGHMLKFLLFYNNRSIVFKSNSHPCYAFISVMLKKRSPNAFETQSNAEILGKIGLVCIFMNIQWCQLTFEGSS